jgi:hypothetical protein
MLNIHEVSRSESESKHIVARIGQATVNPGAVAEAAKVEPQKFRAESSRIVVESKPESI